MKNLSYTNSPYKKIPDELLSKYTLNNKIPIINSFRDTKPSSKIIWDDKLVDKYLTKYTISNIRNNKNTREPYHLPSLMLVEAFEKYKINNKKCAVVGSITPWVEAILINMNNDVTTIEYNVPESQKIKCKSYDDFEKTTDEYDCVITFSSVEHSGLGRYGDPLDPDGDLKTMKSIHNNLKKDGLLFWGAPIGKDCVVWNAHRIYGPIRLSLLFESFTELCWGKFDKKKLFEQKLKSYKQPIVVLIKS